MPPRQASNAAFERAHHDLHRRPAHGAVPLSREGLVSPRVREDMVAQHNKSLANANTQG